MGKDKKKYDHNRFTLTKEQEEYLRSHYPVDTQSDIADYLGISAGVIRRLAMELGLRKADGWSKCQYRNRFVADYVHERYKNYKAA